MPGIPVPAHRKQQHLPHRANLQGKTGKRRTQCPSDNGTQAPALSFGKKNL